jgi:response regulator RpfG family c-di-GMP phosphodiesterase
MIAKSHSKKIALLKTMNIVIIVYALIFPILTLWGIVEHLFHNYILVIYAISALVTYVMTTKHPHNYNSYIHITIIFSLITFTSALIQAPDDQYRAIWFSFIIFVAFFIGSRSVGLKYAAVVLTIFIVYFLTPYNSFELPTILSIILALFILTHLSYFFAGIIEDNEEKLYQKNRELFNYKQNLETVVEEKLKQIASLNNSLVKTQQEVIYTMGAIGESRSKETGNHVKRVAEYSKLLGQLYGLNDNEVEILKIASPMHDIGKVAIPDAILNKPAKLTPKEFEKMKKHVDYGKEMLDHTEGEILNTAAIIAYTHHEKYNGSGYPLGLSQEEIHIYGRITALADVFDALASERAYKKAWELDKVLELIKEERGKHFDPMLVDLFFDNLNLFLEIKEQYRD